MVAAPDAPLSVTVALAPPAVGLNVPEMLNVCGEVVLFTVTATFALVAEFPTVSVATALIVWPPFDNVAVFSV